MITSLTLAQNKLTLLNAKLVVAQQEGSEHDILELISEINKTQEAINILRGEN